MESHTFTDLDGDTLIIDSFANGRALLSMADKQILLTKGQVTKLKKALAQ